MTQFLLEKDQPPPGRTVADLIALLQTHDPSRLVWLEGCDCSNGWDGTVEPAKWGSGGVLHLNADLS